MKHTILLLEDSELVVLSFKSCASPDLNIIVADPQTFTAIDPKEEQKYDGVFVNVSAFCPDISELGAKLHDFEKSVGPTVRFYGYSVRSEAEELLTSWGFSLLRPMHRDFRTDVQEALNRIQQLGLRAEECAAVRADCGACRYNDCKGIIRGSELR